MISQSIRNAALAAVSGAATLAFLNVAIKPSKTLTIADSMRRDLDQYNATVHTEQDPRDTLFDRTQILKDVEVRRPWNKSYAEKERTKAT